GRPRHSGPGRRRPRASGWASPARAAAPTARAIPGCASELRARRHRRPVRAAGAPPGGRQGASRSEKLACRLMSGADVLVWMDLEMTGLDVERDVIVEIAALATTATTLEPLDGGLSVVVAQPPEVLGAMSDFVRRMHERSGLLTEITSGVSLEEAGRKVLEYIKGHVPTPRT